MLMFKDQARLTATATAFVFTLNRKNIAMKKVYQHSHSRAYPDVLNDTTNVKFYTQCKIFYIEGFSIFNTQL